MDTFDPSIWPELDLSLSDGGFTPGVQVQGDSSGPRNEEVSPRPFRFESGCQVVGAQPSSSNRSTEEAIESSRAYICLHPRCNSNKNPTFSRLYDLKRHMKGHVPTKPIACHAAGCESKGRNGFYREDKFYKHIREHHDIDTEWICPEKHCNIEPMCADELVSHLVKDHGSDFKLWIFYRYVAVLPVTVPDKLMCPLGDCTIPIPPYFLPPVPPSRIRIAKSLRNHLEVVHECRLATELATILSDGGSYFKEVDISKFKKGNGVCPICQTDVLAWNGHNLGDHIRQIHGPDAVYACEPDIRNQDCFSSGNLNNQKFVDQFPELLTEVEVQTMIGPKKLMKDQAGETHVILADGEKAALQRGWVPW